MAALDILFNIIDVVVFIIKWFWWVILLCGIFILKHKWKSWPIEVVIIEKRKENLIKTNDRAGKYTDPYTGLVGYRLQMAEDSIPVINYDWILHNVFRPTTIFEKFTNLLRGNSGTIFLFRYGTKQYKPVQINQNGKVKIVYRPIKDAEGKEVFVRVYQQIDPRQKLSLLDFEVVDWDNMNFMVQEQRASIERRSKKSEWIKAVAVPLAALAVTAIVCIVMIKFGYDYALNVKGSVPPQTKATPPNIPIISDVMPGQ